MGELAKFPTRHPDPMANARNLRDEARDAALEVAEMLSAEVSKLADRCAEASRLDTMPAGLRDAWRKVAMSLESQQTTINQIMGNTR